MNRSGILITQLKDSKKMTEKNHTAAIESAQPVFDKKLMTEMAWKSPLNTKDKIIMLAMIHLADDNGICSASYQLLATRCGYTEKTVTKRAIIQLVENGYLKVKPGVCKYGQHTPNSYTVTMGV